MKVKEIYVAKDGKEFATKEECCEYEKVITPKKIILKTWVGRDEWSIYETLQEMGYEFNPDAEYSLKFALNEIDVEIEVDSETGECKVLKLL